MLSIKTIIILLFILLLIPQKSFGVVIGTWGNVYKIKEKDLLTVIKHRIDNINWKKFRKEQHLKRMIKNYQPYSTEVQLPNAKKTIIFEPNMWYTLKNNIYDSMHQLIYPKGFRFKITDFIHLPNILVVINGTEKKQIKWFKHSKYFNNIDVMFMITHGNYYKLDKKLLIPVYYYPEQLQKRFQLKAVPSIIWQTKNTLYVKQISLKHLKIK